MELAAEVFKFQVLLASEARFELEIVYSFLCWILAKLTALVRMR